MLAAPMSRAVPLFRRRLAVSMVLLAGISLVIFVTLAVMFAKLVERQRGVETSIRENALWATYQADRESGRLTESLARAMIERSPEALDLVVLRYDVLYSRASLLEDRVIVEQINTASEVAAMARQARERIRALAIEIDDVRQTSERFLAALPGLYERALEIRAVTEALALAFNTTNNTLRVAERSAIQEAHRIIGLGVVVLVLCLGLVVGLLIAQLVHIARTGRRLQDLSERSARAAEAAEAGNHAKSVFLATMSHEIRTPLNGIIGMAEILAGSELPREQAEQVDLIRQSGDLLLDVINDVLDFSKLESGRIDVISEAVDLRAELNMVHRAMEPRAAAKGLRLDVEAPAVVLTTDPVLLRQIVVNLVGNAVKFTASGSVRIEASLDGPGQLCLRVTDTGEGIPEEALPRLFREFSQVDGSISRRFGGTGLGLAICKRLAEVLGGTIGVSSRLGVGTCFSLRLPVGQIEASAADRAPDPKPDNRSGPRPMIGRVLVVEDNPVNRKVACGLLEAAGLTAVCADDGAAALFLTQSDTFDLILMDMQMPVLDGLAASRLLRARRYTGPIVGLTANAFVSDREACLAAGMNDFVTKPITRAKLAEALGRWLPLAPTQPPGASTGPARIDDDYRATLVDCLGSEAVDDLVRDFVVDARMQIQAARAALNTKDRKTFDDLLHTIKGAASSLGFTAIAQLARQTRQGDAACLELLSELVAALDADMVEAPRAVA